MAGLAKAKEQEDNKKELAPKELTDDDLVIRIESVLTAIKSRNERVAEPYIIIVGKLEGAIKRFRMIKKGG